MLLVLLLVLFIPIWLLAADEDDDELVVADEDDDELVVAFAGGAAPFVNVLIHCGPNFITVPDMI